MIKRRPGPGRTPAGSSSPLCLRGCPDLFELESGDFAAIGRDLTAEALRHLPADAGCGPDERLVWLPRRTLVLARPDIPTQL